MRQLPKALLLTTGITLLGSPVTAQVGGRVIDSLHVDRRIRVETLQGSRVAGQVLSVDSYLLRLRTVERPSVHRAVFATREIALDSLARVWVYNGRHARTGAVIGGLVVGGALSYVILKLCADPDGGNCDPAEVVGGIGIFSGIGAVFGGLLGATVIRWRPI